MFVAEILQRHFRDYRLQDIWNQLLAEYSRLMLAFVRTTCQSHCKVRYVPTNIHFKPEDFESPGKARAAVHLKREKGRDPSRMGEPMFFFTRILRDFVKDHVYRGGPDQKKAMDKAKKKRNHKKKTAKKNAAKKEVLSVTL